MDRLPHSFTSIGILVCNPFIQQHFDVSHKMLLDPSDIDETHDSYAHRKLYLLVQPFLQLHSPFDITRELLVGLL